MPTARVEPNDAGVPPALEPERLRGLTPERRLPGRNRTKADILVYRYDGVEIAVKDYAARPWPIRQLLGRWLVRRECAAYEAAAGVAGLPPFLGRLGPFALATRWIDATPLAELARETLRDECFESVERILQGLHQRGVALADLHHRDVLVAGDGAVHIVDLAMACVLGPRPGWFSRRLFRRACEQDGIALLRMRARFRGEDPDAAVAALGGAAARWHRRGRRAKALLDRLRGKSRPPS